MKISYYTTIVKNDDRYLLHNTMYNSSLMVYSDRLRRYIDMIEDGSSFEENESDEFLLTLKDLNMVIEDTENELSTLNSRFFSFEHNSELYVMLIVTRRCNFRCAYCYEEYTNSDMSPGIFDNTRKFIINEIKKHHYNNVYVSFFGGEPTLMADEIVSFMESLLSDNELLDCPASIRGLITTNGYLLTPSMIDIFIKTRS